MLQATTSNEPLSDVAVLLQVVVVEGRRVFERTHFTTVKTAAVDTWCGVISGSVVGGGVVGGGVVGGGVVGGGVVRGGVVRGCLVIVGSRGLVAGGLEVVTVGLVVEEAVWFDEATATNATTVNVAVVFGIDGFCGRCGRDKKNCSK